MGFFEKIKAGLKKTKQGVMSQIDGILKSMVKIDEDLFEELLDILIAADVGVETSTEITERLEERVRDERTTDPAMVRELLKEVVKEILVGAQEQEKAFGKPHAILMVGVNGVGKTTTIAKLANIYKSEGKKVLLGAADTFRAAAAEQLAIWAGRVGVDIVKQHEGVDPASVVFDTCSAGKSRGADVIICDTAGRLHNKKNLMDELSKIMRVISREIPGDEPEVLLVCDATTGQNGLVQAKEFMKAVPVTGLVLTKLDGTAKGGIVIAIANELKIPVRYVGVGEQVDDLQRFSAEEFTDALFDGEE